MHLAGDYIYPYKEAGGHPARCRVQMYLPDDVRDAPVVGCLELPNQPWRLDHLLVPNVVLRSPYSATTSVPPNPPGARGWQRIAAPL
jgi:hypothetical protein